MADVDRHLRSLRATALQHERAAQRAILAAWRSTWGGIATLLDGLVSAATQARLQGVRLTARWFNAHPAYWTLLGGLQGALGRFAGVVGAVVASARNGVAAAVGPLAAGVVGVVTQAAAGVALAAPFLPVASPLALVAGLVKALPGIVADVARAVRAGLTRNLPPRQVATAARQAANAVPVRALATSRTTVHEAAREAALATYRLHPEAIDRWRWRCSRGPRTCGACWARDGQVYPVSRGFDSHPCCRCTVEPVSRGATPSGDTGPEAFARLDEATQRAILGPGKLALYQSGMLTLGDLVQPTQSARYAPGMRERSLRELRTA